MTHRISLIHPTARVSPSEEFPRGWRDACAKWFARCDNPAEVEYVISVHESRWAEFWRNAIVDGIGHTMIYAAENLVMSVEKWGDVTVVKNTGRDCVVDQTNCAAAASTGLLIIGAQDDFFPPEHWDTLLLEAICGPEGRCPMCGWPYSDSGMDAGCLPGNCSMRPLPKAKRAYGGSEALDTAVMVVCSCSDDPERDKTLMIASALTRKRYETYGWVLDPDFESMYADNWYGHVNRRDAEAGLLHITYRMDIRFEHEHPIYTGRKMDSVYQLQNRQQAYAEGQLIFQQKVTGSRVMVACLPGESFRSELTASRFQLIEAVKGNTPYGIVAPHWCHTTNVYATRIELTKAALDFPSCTKDQDLVLTADDDNPLDFGQLSMLMQDLDEHPELGGILAWCWCDHNEAEDGEARKWVMSCGRQDTKTLDCLRFTSGDFDQAIARGDFLIGSDHVAPHAFWSGLPVMLIRRSVLQQMGWRAFIARTADPVLVNALRLAAHWVQDVVAFEEIQNALQWAEVLDSTRNGMTSEDTSFFIRAHELGIKFAVDLRVRVQHVKWRGIAPQYVPEREREQVERNKGARFGQDTVAILDR